MTDVVDVLAAAGARIHSLEMAATAGGITGWARSVHAAEVRDLRHGTRSSSAASSISLDGTAW
jgi:hypothetical protein